MASRKKSYNPQQVIENLELWQSLTKEEQVYLESNIEFISYKKNSIIYSDGEEPTKLLGVLSGFVKINREGVGVRSQIVRIIKPNELFGYRAMFAGEKYITTAYAVEATTILAKTQNLLLSLSDSFLSTLVYLTLVALCLHKNTYVADLRKLSFT